MPAVLPGARAEVHHEVRRLDHLPVVLDDEGRIETANPGATRILRVPLAFAMVHVQFLTAIVWALLIAWLLVRTKSLGACIVAHAVTNLLLGVYVLVYRDWAFW